MLMRNRASFVASLATLAPNGARSRTLLERVGPSASRVFRPCSGGGARNTPAQPTSMAIRLTVLTWRCESEPVGWDDAPRREPRPAQALRGCGAPDGSTPTVWGVRFWAGDGERSRARLHRTEARRGGRGPAAGTRAGALFPLEYIRGGLSFGWGLPRCYPRGGAPRSGE